jgi:hypothetical protein
LALEQEVAGVSNIEIQLSGKPDGFGFFYGTARRGDTVVRVNVLPPAFLWQGDMQLDDHKPDATHWQVFADGELIAKIARQEDVGAALVPLLTNR